MDVNKIVLHKIIIRKTKKFENRSVISEKDLVNIKSESSIEHNLPNNAILDDISLETNQNVINIYPRNMAMAGDGRYQITDDLKSDKKCELNITILEEENKSRDSVSNNSICSDPPFELSMFESSPCRTASSNFSLPLESSFAFFGSESSAQDIRYDKLPDENNASAKDWCAEWEKDMLPDYSAESAISLLTYSINPSNTDSVEENIPITIPRYSNDSSIKTNNSKKSDAKKESALSMSAEKSLLCQLRKSLENSTKYLLKYLERIENRNLKREKLNVEKNNLVSKSNTSECKYKGKNVEKEREVNSPNGSLPKSHILKNSTTSVATNILKEEYLIQVDSSENVHMDLLNTEYSECGCNCCNGRCLHFEKVGKNSNDDLLKEAKNLKKKAKATVSEIVDVSDNLSMPNIELKKYQSGFDLKKQNLPPFVDIPKLFKIKPTSTTDGFKNKLVQTSYPADDDFLDENNISLAKESVQNMLNQRKIKECSKRSAESKLLAVPYTYNESAMYRKNEDEEIEKEETENQYNTIVKIYFVMLLVVPLLLFFHFFILICT